MNKAIEPRTENEKELVEMLLEAVSLIKFWHNFPAFNTKLPKEEIERTWRIYYKCAPEMNHIREKLAEYELEVV